MFVNQNYTTRVDCKCRACKHKDICKWKSEKERIDKDLSSIEITPLAPISLSANCKNYEVSTINSNTGCTYR